MFRLMAVRIDTSCLWSIHEEMCFVTAEAMVNERSEILQNHLDLDVFGLNFDADSDAGKRCFYEYQVYVLVPSTFCIARFLLSFFVNKYKELAVYKEFSGYLL